MKNKLLMLSIFIVAILAVSAVSANENATDVVSESVGEDMELQEDVSAGIDDEISQKNDAV